MVKLSMKYLVGTLTYPFFAMFLWAVDFIDRMHKRGLLLEEYDCYPWERRKIRFKISQELDKLIFNQYYADMGAFHQPEKQKTPSKKNHLTVVKGETDDEQ